jgi:hypothetical protein
MEIPSIPVLIISTALAFLFGWLCLRLDRSERSNR